MTFSVARFKRNPCNRKKKYFSRVEDNVGMSYIETVKEKELHFKTVLIILHPNLQVIKSHLLVQ